MAMKIRGVKETLKRINKEFKLEIGTQKKSITKSLVKRLKEATPVDTGEARDGWGIRNGHIVNDVDHIGDLNAGSSQQAPAYFVETTVLTHPGVKPSGTIVKKT